MMDDMDTLEVSEKLVNEGFTNTQAKILTRLLAEQELRLATKEDIQELREDTKEDIQELKVDTKEDIKSLRNEVRWLFGMAAILAGLKLI